MHQFWGIFGKRITQLNVDEKIILTLVVLLAITFLVLSVSAFLQVARRFERTAGSSESEPLLRKGMERIARTDYYREQARSSHAD